MSKTFRNVQNLSASSSDEEGIFQTPARGAVMGGEMETDPPPNTPRKRKMMSSSPPPLREWGGGRRKSTHKGRQSPLRPLCLRRGRGGGDGGRMDRQKNKQKWPKGRPTLSPLR
eukprot:TRINITY_DN50850_c1_g2_i2.p2 TRINITY_DN50850_c1_g2~~TRINITY_DN50850_c1_g2_i2.p2  ORF type:complete len:114 (-),score=16.07 TRINITY_DN50850_c1_g2_i2:286-627(-)